MKKIIFIYLFLGYFGFSQSITLDGTFGIGGKKIESMVAGDDIIISTKLQSNGKIVVAGSLTYSPNGNIILSRFNIDGSLDNSFGINGKILTSLINEVPFNSSLKIQSDDKILITASLFNSSSNFDFATSRYNSNGSIDTSFGINGTVTTDLGNLTSDFANAIEIQSDNKIVVSGTTMINFQSDFAVVRYLPNGILDTTFGNNGTFTCNIGSFNTTPTSNESSRCIKFSSDGKIYIGGSTNAQEILSDAYNFAIIRLNNNGSLDNSFGVGGKVITDFSRNENFFKLDLTNDNKLIVSGSSQTYQQQQPASNKTAIAKYQENGDLDISFGINGKLLLDVDGIIYDFIIQPDNKILGCGYIFNNSTILDFLLIKLKSDGGIDTDFNSIGYIRTDFNMDLDGANSLVIQTDGKIICGGASKNNTKYDFSLCRYNVQNLSTTQFNNSKFSISPNPFNESINLKFNFNQDGSLTIDLFDSNGRKIDNLLSNKNFQSGDNEIKLDLPETLCKGIYFLNINNGNEISTIKIVK
jgi:uncharacterized delta-60 repeat protein